MTIYTCCKCAKKFNHRNDYNKHVNRKVSCEPMKVKPKFACNKCNKIFTRKDNLDRHILNYCKDKAVKPIELVVNNNPSNPDDKPIDISCKYCKKSYTTKTSMYRHLRLYCKIKKCINPDRQALLDQKDAEISRLNKIIKNLINK